MPELKIHHNPYEDPSHARAIVEVLDTYARDPMGGATPLAPDTRANLVRELKGRNWAHVFLACLDHEPAGLLIAMEGFSTFKAQPLLNIHDVAVVPARRGQGIGQALFAAAEAAARNLGCCKLTLEVLTGNIRAQRLYRNLGFRPYELDPAQGHAEFWEKPLQH